jgi:putative transposase
VQNDGHLLTLCRYVESNALRAGLVRRAENWRWCGVGRSRGDGAAPLIAVAWPADRPRNWLAIVNEPLGERDLTAVRTSILRERPFGEDGWVRRTAARLGLQFTLNPRGRPKERKE